MSTWKSVFARAAAAVLCTGVAANAWALTETGTRLYDATLGTLPTQQGWLSISAAATETLLSDGGGSPIALRFDSASAANNAIQDGNSRFDQSLDTGVGFELSWRLRVESETHADDDRGGFSIIMVGAQQQHALELTFWTTEVWAYAFNPADSAFTHGPGYLVDTTLARDYRLRVQNHGYQLFVDGGLAIAGSLLDYDAEDFPDPFDPYNIPNSLFFGDDTKRARAKVELEHITLSAIPLPAAWVLCMPALGALFATSRRRKKLRA